MPWNILGVGVVGLNGLGIVRDVDFGNALKQDMVICVMHASRVNVEEKS